jgi:hypothetical protein
MKKLFAAVLSVAVAVSLSPVVSSAQSTCPAEVAQAKDMLTKKTAAAKADNDQVPRSLAGARQNVAQAPRENQNVQAPRENQNVQAPRENQNVQAPRENQNVQAPRENQNVQAPRENQNVQAPRENQNVQAPRENQNVQAPRENQNVQAPRENQNVQAPRENQNVQAPRENQNVQAPRTNEEINQAPRSGAGATTTAQALRADMTKAASLVKQAEAACKAGNLTQASDRAKAALAILK